MGPALCLRGSIGNMYNLKAGCGFHPSGSSLDIYKCRAFTQHQILAQRCADPSAMNRIMDEMRFHQFHGCVIWLSVGSMLAV